MKVGVDSVLVGCWADVAGARRILDVGTGCGVIALIIAQRVPSALIDAIDVDVPSVEEARENVSESPWASRVKVTECSFADARITLKPDEGYDLIISNPPYFDSGVAEIQTARERARHQGELSPSVLIAGAIRLLRPGGSVAMVVPAELSERLEADAFGMGYSLTGKCLVRGHADAPFKRVLLQWKLSNVNADAASATEHLTLAVSPGEPTKEYRRLCGDFYLKF